MSANKAGKTALALRALALSKIVDVLKFWSGVKYIM